jgi:hypothetical protein
MLKCLLLRGESRARSSFLTSFADQSLKQRDAVLNGLGLITLRRGDTYAREFKLAIDSVARPELYNAKDLQALQALSWEVFYTDLICRNLERGEFGSLLSMLTDLFNMDNPLEFAVRNIALFNMLRKWEPHFVAMELIITILGSVRQKTDARTLYRQPPEVHG